MKTKYIVPVIIVIVVCVYIGIFVRIPKIDYNSEKTTYSLVCKKMNLRFDELTGNYIVVSRDLQGRPSFRNVNTEVDAIGKVICAQGYFPQDINSFREEVLSSPNLVHVLAGTPNYGVNLDKKDFVPSWRIFFMNLILIISALLSAGYYLKNNE